jgi:protein gp37
MGFKTGISWTDHSYNAWWGCTPTAGDPACTNCYVLRDSKRFGLDIFGANRPRRYFGPDHWREPLKWDRLAAREGRMHRVFCNSMGDVFEDYRAQTGSETARLEYWMLILDCSSTTQTIRALRFPDILSVLDPCRGTTVVDWPASGRVAVRSQCISRQY